MINNIKIENYKSLHNLKLDVGRFNILIGENGCGKSNILEAITLAAAAEADKLDNEFLSSRGIRVTDSHFMRSAFSNEPNLLPITIKVQEEDRKVSRQYKLINDGQPYSKWTSLETEDGLVQLDLTDLDLDIEINYEYLTERLKIIEQSLENRKKTLDRSEKLLDKDQTEFLNILSKNLSKNKTKLESLQNFVIYSPENTALRNFHKEGQIEPLGINGEGLLKLLKTIRESTAPTNQPQKNKKGFFSFLKAKTETKDLNRINEIQAALQLFDWYEDLQIPEDLSESEDKVKVADRYIGKSFDQRSTNEGFLFVLFYLSLIVSEDTPKIFAIDNIDASLNPKLCSKLIKELTRLAKKYDKQVFVTTHNPAILDGIDLGDSEQRLLVISRNRTGHTRCKRIKFEDKPKSSTGEPLKLSEAFLRGYLGGLPKGF